jgi:hypothetical protein
MGDPRPVHAVVDGVAVVQAVGEQGEGFDLTLGADCLARASLPDEQGPWLWVTVV